jgi:haloacid dehalogenase-like hydrolase
MVKEPKWSVLNCPARLRVIIDGSVQLAADSLSRQSKRIRRSTSKGDLMQAIRPVAAVSRRFLLSSLAVLPALSSPLLQVSVRAQTAADPLPSWNDGRAKQSILDFVAAVTRQGSPYFVPELQRIATFDNDGTLWVEQPLYTQLVFAIDRVKALAPNHPEWKAKQPFKAALEGDINALLVSGEHGLVELILATHTGMTVEEFENVVEAWLATARHPRFKRPYTDLVYQPMLEVLAYLRSNGFQTFIVSGGGIEFLRPFTVQVYGVLPQQVVGSSVKTRFEMRDGRPMLFRLPQVNFVDDKAGKPVGINEHIGRRPIAAFGNSDGDLEMLQWTTLAGNRRRLGLIVHHTDAVREYAYDRQSRVGRLDKALDAATINGWTVASMKDDWKEIFPTSIARAIK